MFVIAPKNGEVFSRETLSLVESLTEKTWQLPYSNRVDSFSNFQHTEAEGDSLIVADLVNDAANFTERDLARAINYRACGTAVEEISNFRGRESHCGKYQHSAAKD